MNILVIGAGGREHALCWKIRQSREVSLLYCAPGNAGIAAVAHCVDLDALDHDAILTFVSEMAIDLVVVGPEAPLVAGLVDALNRKGIRAFGPTAAAAMLEGSKGYTKDLCAEYHIPTADYARFDNEPDALTYLSGKPLPIVIKADGLAAGKGVIIAQNAYEAEAAIKSIFGGDFGTAGNEVVIEEFLEGEEASYFALVDGAHILPLATAQDHKKVGEGDTGANTGGMGAYSPAPVMSESMCKRVETEIIQPTVDAMKARGAPFCGILYAGLMITKDGPKLIEYNVRFGDPECQALMVRMASDIVPLLVATCDGRLADQAVDWKDGASVTVVMASQGYPGPYKKNTPIKGLIKAGHVPDTIIFHAGTHHKDGTIVAMGGRVLNVTSTGESVKAACQKAYRAVDLLDWPEGFCRRDIGWRAIERENDIPAPKSL